MFHLSAVCQFQSEQFFLEISGAMGIFILGSDSGSHFLFKSLRANHFSNFPRTNSLECKFGNSRAGESPGSWETATLVKCVTPAGQVGNTTVSLIQSGLVLGTSAQTFSFIPLHAVKSLNPSTGSEAGGIQVTVDGSGFDTGMSTLMCVFGEMLGVTGLCPCPGLMIASACTCKRRSTL